MISEQGNERDKEVGLGEVEWRRWHRSCHQLGPSICLPAGWPSRPASSQRADANGRARQIGAGRQSNPDPLGSVPTRSYNCNCNSNRHNPLGPGNQISFSLSLARSFPSAHSTHPTNANCNPQTKRSLKTLINSSRQRENSPLLVGCMCDKSDVVVWH